MTALVTITLVEGQNTVETRGSKVDVPKEVSDSSAEQMNAWILANALPGLSPEIKNVFGSKKKDEAFHA